MKSTYRENLICIDNGDDNLVVYTNRLIDSVIFSSEEYKNNPYFANVCHFIISYIYGISVIKTRKKNSSIFLYSKYLPSFTCRNRYNQARKFLVDNGILVVNNSYSVGHFCKSYSIGPRFVKEKFYNIKLEDRPWRKRKGNCFSKFAGYLKNQQLAAEKSDDDCAAIKAFLTSSRLEIDVDSIEKEVESMPETTEKEVNKKNSYEYYYNSLKNKNQYAKKCPKSGRLFTLEGNCPKKFRKHFKLDGEKMLEVDLHQSQPTCLLKLYDENLQTEKEEASKYRKFLQNEDFYLFFNSKSERPKPVSERDRIKINTYSTLLFGGINLVNTSICRSFAAEFPILWGKMLKLKRAGSDKLPLALQKIESDIFIKILFQRIKNELGMVGFPIHDAFLVKESSAAEVQKFFKQELEKQFGFEVKVKIKN